QANIESIERNIGDWQATFNKKNPQFKSLFNQNLNITRLVNTLREDEVLLRYFMFEDLAFLVEISKREVKSYYLGNKYHVEAEVISLIKVIKNPSSDYFPQSIRVFEKLLPNWERLHSYSKFTIISDGVLQLLPFEALISSQEKKFIAEQKEVRYSRNLTNYEFSSQLQQKTRSGFYVYSPIYGAQSALPGAMQEGQAISTKLHPILRQNASGSKYNFLKDSEYAKVLHIAAHAAVGEKESSSHIIFSDDKLHVDELYHLEIPAELVVLAACNTGLGSEEGYEAFNSLGQAFSFAGVQTLVYTLWAIPDEQSATLMTNFYQHLAKGEDKSKALTLAKQQFLQVASTNERHPYFWSGFIIQGHPGQLELENTFLHLNKWIGSILGLLLIFAALLYIRKKQSKTN
ncbi:MAG: CHAT domain-containing protein, partial [Schleiferiaceae bacterium]|nr:CHAT domain-containing protein [Schleiferiaceae bacterium]